MLIHLKVKCSSQSKKATFYSSSCDDVLPVIEFNPVASYVKSLQASLYGIDFVNDASTSIGLAFRMRCKFSLLVLLLQEIAAIDCKGL